MMQPPAPEPGSLSVTIAQSVPFPLQIAFQIDAGDVLALIGPSGSGKTSTLRAIAGLSRPAHGRISCGANDWLNSDNNTVVRPEDRRVGLVFQDYALFPHLIVLDNITLAMGHLAASKRRDAGNALLQRLGIAHLSQRRPRTLSGGERQRVGLARALARDPSVLLLDEPFSAVDRPTREKLKREVRDIVAHLRTPTILVTHDIDDVVAIANRMIVIDSGVMLADGEPRALLSNPPDQRVAEIIGADGKLFS